MSLVLRAGRPFVERVLVATGDWKCPDCPFHRNFETKGGAISGAARHMAEEHGVRLVLPPTAFKTAIAAALLFVGGALAGADPAATPAPASPTPIASDCEHVPTGFDGCPVQWAAYAGTAHMFSSVAPRAAVALSRVQADVLGPAAVHVFARGETSARPDQSGAADGNWASAGLAAGIYQGIGGELSVECAAGAAFPLDTKGAPASLAYGCGAFVGKPRGRRWLLINVGHSDSLLGGDGAAHRKSLNAIMPSFQFPLKGETYAFGDGGIGLFARDYYVLTGVIVRVP